MPIAMAVLPIPGWPANKIMRFIRPQVIELAVGLETSRHRFLWLLRSPSRKFLSIEVTEISQLLPKGFESRT
jgi:hypothetical protein